MAYRRVLLIARLRPASDDAHAGARNGQSSYLFAGMVRCSSGHQPLSMYGHRRKGHVYMSCDYGRTYGKVAADQIEGHGQWLSIREDVLLPLVERFFAERVFGPMRLEKLARQLRVHEKRSRGQADKAVKELREHVADLDRRVGAQIEALEAGVEPALVRKRIEKLRRDKERAEAELAALGPASAGSDASEDLPALLGRIPDLSRALHGAPTELKRQVFEAFCLRIAYDKVERRIEISATVSEAVAKALEKAEDLPEEVSSVAQRDIAGARLVPQSDARVLQQYRVAA